MGVVQIWAFEKKKKEREKTWVSTGAAQIWAFEKKKKRKKKHGSGPDFPTSGSQPLEFLVTQSHCCMQLDPQVNNGHGRLQEGPNHPARHSQMPKMRLQ